MRLSILIALSALAGCGGGGGDSAPAQTSDSGTVTVADVICEGLAILFGGECVGIEPIDNPPPPPETVRVSPRLSIREQSLPEVTIDWLPPDESWEGRPPPFVSGYVIRLSKWNAEVGVFFGVDTITLSDPTTLTYVLEIPEPGRWIITVAAISSYTGNESPRSGYVEVNFQPESRPVAPVLAIPLDPMPGSHVVTLDWTPPSQNEDGTPLMDLTGYMVYFGQLSGIYTDFQRLDNPGLVTYVLDLPAEGIWYVATTAFNSQDLESAFSNEIVVQITPDAPPPPEMP